MPRPSRYPRHPVRVLRDHLGFRSAQSFAEFTGVPAETIRNLEQGRRAVTDRVAMQIGIATGVFPDWLREGNVARGKPIDAFGKPLSKEAFEQFAGVKARIAADPDHGDDADLIDDMCTALTALLRTAARKGRLPQCSYAIRLAVRDAANEFGLTKAMKNEDTTHLNERFRHTVRFGEKSDLDFGDYIAASRLLSPTATFRWNAELGEERDSSSSDVLADIDLLQSVVEASFDMKAKPRRGKKSSFSNRREV